MRKKLRKKMDVLYAQIDKKFVMTKRVFRRELLKRAKSLDITIHEYISWMDKTDVDIIAKSLVGERVSVWNRIKKNLSISRAKKSKKREHSIDTVKHKHTNRTYSKDHESRNLPKWKLQFSFHAQKKDLI